MPSNRKLTALEVDFVNEAVSLCFLVDYDEEGAPYAHGATQNGNCFSMAVEEHPDSDGLGSTYYLKSRQ